MKMALVTVTVLVSAWAQSDPNSGIAKPQSQPAVQNDPFKLLRVLEGRWHGTGEGQSGNSTVERTYEFVMGGKYLHVRNASSYKPNDKNPKGENHEDWGMYSFDKARRKLVLRQFHIEGFVNQYVMERVSDDGKEITFVTEFNENLPPGVKGRETYRMTGSDTMLEVFEVAMPGKEFTIYSTSTLKRVR